MDKKELLAEKAITDIVKNMLKEVENKSKSNKTLEAIEIIDKYDYLQKAFKYIIENSSSNGLPYHNLNHLLTVLKYCYMGSIELERTSDLKELLLAAIFHDVNHSGGKKTDDKNVEDAKEAVKNFIEKEKIDVNINSINKILDATQYPYVIEGKDLTLSQAIIRDSDLMQVYEYNWIHQNIYGLSQEMKIDFFKFVDGQRKFLDNAVFNTDWAKKLKEEKWDNTMKQFEMLEKIAKL